MTLEKMKITLDPSGDSYEYHIYPIQSIDQSSEKSAMSIALPGQSPRDNILMGLSGMEGSITINFYIHNDGTDRANGTYSSTIITIDEQIDYLLYTIHDPSFNASWQLDDITGSLYDAEEVYLEKIDLPTMTSDTPRWLECRMGLILGESI